MPFPIEEKLVIAVASSALFALDEADAVFRQEGVRSYREYQRKHENDVLAPGIAFPFVRRFLELNNVFPQRQPVEVVLLSRNDSDTGMRVFNSIEHYKLGIIRAAFTRGNLPFRYIPAYNVSLFLSGNESDVVEALQNGYPAGLVLPSAADDDTADAELRVAFDFDGVVIDDESEQQYKNAGLEGFTAYETQNANSPHRSGPLTELFKKLAYFQKLDMQRRGKDDPFFQPIIRISIVTARGAPSEERLITTLKSWGMNAAELFLLDGMPKHYVLEQLRPHIFFDDQMAHLENTIDAIPSVLVPFGVNSERSMQNFVTLANSKRNH